MSESGDHVNFLHFPTDGIVSLIYALENGSSSEIALVGNEGMVGISIFMGGESMPSDTKVQSAGHAYRLNRKKLEARACECHETVRFRLKVRSGKRVIHGRVTQLSKRSPDTLENSRKLFVTVMSPWLRACPASITS